MPLITSSYEIHAKLFPEKIAVYTKDQKVNYREWFELVNQTANWFHSLKAYNKTVGIYLPNGIPFLQLFAGAAAAGWTAVPFDLKWKESELSQRLELAAPSVWITTRGLYEKVKLLYPNVMVWEDCLKKLTQSFSGDPIMVKNGGIPFYMGFTSGSTGKPKAFIRSHNSWVASFACTKIDFHIRENDHVLIPGSLIHSHFLYGAICTLFLGGTVYLLEKFTAAQTLTILQTYPISVAYFVPTMVEALLREEVLINLSLKIISSGAKWEEHSKIRVKEMIPNLSMYEFYGASELSFVTFSNDEQKLNSVGRPFHNVDLQIRRANGEIAAANEIGKIYVHSKMTFIGYIDLEQREVQTIEDENGWVTVHDMGYLDEDGYLFVVGRENNMILYGGINIFPEEIESILSKHPQVESAAVIGLTDSYWGQIVAAVVQGKTVKSDLKRWCKLHLASYKVPRKWYFIEEMPLTTSGKIARAILKDQLEGRMMRQ